MAKLEFKGRESLNVTLSELIIAPAVSIGAVLFAEKFLPHQMSTLKHYVADHVIRPHLEGFEKVGGHVFKAYDTQNKKEFKEGESEDEKLSQKPYSELTSEERSHKIAGILTKTGLAFVSESAAALVSQVALNKAIGGKVNPYVNVAFDAGIHAVAIGSFMTFLAPAVESAKDSIANILHKSLGIKKEDAKDSARIFTYVSAPSWLAFLGTLSYVNLFSGKGKSGQGH